MNKRVWYATITCQIASNLRRVCLERRKQRPRGGAGLSVRASPGAFMAARLLPLSAAHRQVAVPRLRRAPRCRCAPRIMAASASSPLGYDLNFGAASSLDGVVYGAVRPGGAGGEEVTPAGSIPDADVSAWAAHMQAQGITRVVSLLDPSELTAYASPLGDQYGRLFKRCVLFLA